MTKPREFIMRIVSGCVVQLTGVDRPTIQMDEEIRVREVDLHQDDDMLVMARHAVRAGTSRSSFAQWAEWAHDEATEEAKGETE